jgi:hypothetical protein
MDRYAMAQREGLRIPKSCHNLTPAIYLRTAALAALTLANKHLRPNFHRNPAASKNAH